MTSFRGISSGSSEKAASGPAKRSQLLWACASLFCFVATSGCKVSNSKNKSVSHNDNGRYTYVIDEPVVLQQGQLNSIADTSSAQAVQDFVNKSNARCYFLYENTNENLNLGLEKDRRLGISRVITRPFLTQYAIPDDVLLVQLKTQPELAQFASIITGKAGTPGLTSALTANPAGGQGPMGLTGSSGSNLSTLDPLSAAQYFKSLQGLEPMQPAAVYRAARDKCREDNIDDPKGGYDALSDADKVACVSASLKEIQDLFPELGNQMDLFNRQAANLPSLDKSLLDTVGTSELATPDSVDKIIALSAPAPIFVGSNLNAQSDQTANDVAAGAATGAAVSLVDQMSLAGGGGLKEVLKKADGFFTQKVGNPFKFMGAVAADIKVQLGVAKKAVGGVASKYLPTATKAVGATGEVAKGAAAGAGKVAKGVGEASSVSVKKFGNFVVKSGKGALEAPGTAVRWLGDRLHSVNVARMCYEGKGLGGVLSRSACLSAIGAAGVYGFDHFFNHPPQPIAPEADPQKVQNIAPTVQAAQNFQAGMNALTPNLNSDKAETMVAYQALLIQLGSQPNGPSCENLKAQLKFRYWGDAK